MAQTRKSPSRWPGIAGIVAVALFIAIYAVELLPHHGPPAALLWLRQKFGTAGLIIPNILIVLAFLALLPYRRPTRNTWKSRGVFVAFVIALMTEMFGWPLFIFIASPLLDIPRIAPEYFDAIGRWPVVLGTAFSIAGVLLIALGWRRIHSAEGLVTDGIYRYIRHPQYTGLFLFTLGWILHWPSIITLLLWPVLTAAYVWLARFEERQAIAEFGTDYEDYARRTKRFIPYIV